MSSVFENFFFVESERVSEMPLTNRRRLVNFLVWISQIFGFRLQKPNRLLLQNDVMFGHDFAQIDQGIAHASQGGVDADVSHLGNFLEAVVVVDAHL